MAVYGQICSIRRPLATLQVTHRPRKENTVAGTYTGLTGGPFKKRFYTHRATFKKDTTKNRTATRLAEKVWELKDQSRQPNISWSVLARARPYNPITRRCDLCIAERYFILYKPETASLNRRSELFTSCRHIYPTLLSPPERKRRAAGVG